MSVIVCEHEYGDALHEDLKEDFKYVLFRVIADVKVDFSHLKVFSYRILDRGRKYEYVMDAEDYFKFVRIYGMDCILEDELLTPRTAKDLERILPDCAVIEESSSRIVLYVPKDRIGLFIGRNGWKARRLSEIMRKRVVVRSGYLLHFNGLFGRNVRVAVEYEGAVIDRFVLPLQKFVTLVNQEGVRLLSKGLGLGGIPDIYLMSERAYQNLR